MSPESLAALTGLSPAVLGPAVSGLVQAGDLVRDGWLVRLPQAEDLLPSSRPAEADRGGQLRQTSSAGPSVIAERSGSGSTIGARRADLGIVMRIITLLAFGLVPATSLAQKPAAPPRLPSMLAGSGMVVEERIGQANFECDYKFFADVEAPEFIFTSAAGNLITRAENLAGEKDCRTRREPTGSTTSAS